MGTDNSSIDDMVLLQAQAMAKEMAFRDFTEGRFKSRDISDPSSDTYLRTYEKLQTNALYRAMRDLDKER